MAFDRFKLQKLEICAYKDEKRTGTPVLVFEAMFNPASYSQAYPIHWTSQKVADTGKTRLVSDCRPPRELSLKLVLDGTGVTEMGVRALGRKSVEKRVKELLGVAFDRSNTTGEANYLCVRWGESLDFPCRLTSLTVSYTKFDREGAPIRADLDLKLLSDEALEAQKTKSPTNATQARTAKSGDTLPMLSKDVYGSSDHYLEIAKYNELDDFRNLTPGQELVFPPLAAFGGK